MNDLETSFSKITTMDFLLEQLQEAVDSENHLAIVETSVALNAFLPVFTANFDRKFKAAWNQTVTDPREKLSDLFE